MVKKLLLTLLAVILCSSFALGQGTIKGTVKDQSGSPLSYINVNLNKEGVNVNYTMTDAEGNYQLHGVPAGTYDLEFDATLGSCGKKLTMSGIKFTGQTFIQDATINCPRCETPPERPDTSYDCRRL